MATYTLDFERPLLEIEKQIEELKRNGGEQGADTGPLERQLAELRAEIYRNLTPMQRVQVARHPRRPYTIDYLQTIFSDFVELHGDRLFRDDPALVGGPVWQVCPAWNRLAARWERSGARGRVLGRG